MKASKKVEYFNKKARFDYTISESLEAGLVLSGHEIKAIREGRVNLTGSYVKIMNGEAFWVGGDIAVPEGDRQRTRKLMLHRDQIKRLLGKSAEEGSALIPLKLYLARGFAKLELGIGKGKKKYDKRESLKKRDQEREIGRGIKNS
ncbi:MAG: SsrA-binding protein SmpB [Patescibacteria group bacterium]